VRTPADLADSLAPGVGLFADQDPVLFGQALAAAALGIARRPIEGARMGARTAGDLGRVPAVAAARMVGASPEPPVADDGKDRRFADRAWEDNAAFFALRQAYLLLGRLTEELIAISDVDDRTRSGRAGRRVSAVGLRARTRRPGAGTRGADVRGHGRR
jgi:polyhydroxyalkanoate synthase